MQVGKAVRLAWTVITVGCGAFIGLNFQTIAQRMGWDHLIADAAVPLNGPSPLVEFVTQPLVLAAFLVSSGIAAGLWIDTALRSIEKRIAAKKWWYGLQSFSLRNCGCIIADVTDSEFEKSPRAKATADEFRGYVNSGHLPLMLELKADRPITGLAAVYNTDPPYSVKSVGYDAVILKSELETIARARGWELPWPIPPKKARVEPKIPPPSAPVPAPLTSGLQAEISKALAGMRTQIEGPIDG